MPTTGARHLRFWLGLALLWAVAFTHGSVRAQLHRPTGPVLVPASAYLLQDDALATEVNPALLGLLPAASAAYVHAEIKNARTWLGRGDAVHLGSPIAFGLSAGLSLHSIRPGEGSLLLPGGRPADRGLAVLSLAYALSPRLSVGVSGRGLTSGHPLLDGLGSVDIGLAYRPSTVFGFSLAARDLFLSREGFGSAGLPAGTAFLAGLQVRPFGTSSLVVDGQVLVDSSWNAAGRFSAGLGLPRLGFLSAVAEVEPLAERGAELRVMAELSASYGQGTVALGAVGDDRLETGLDWYGMLRFDGLARTDRVVEPRILDVELSDLSERGMVRTALLLLGAVSDRRIGGVLLRMRDSGIGTAYAQEIRLLLSQLRSANKVAACHLENASGPEYYACSGSAEVSIDPAGSVRFVGPSATVMLFGEALRKLHVRADFLRIGAHKSAAEQLTLGQMSEESRSQMLRLLDETHRRILSDVAQDMSRPMAEIADLMDQGPHLASRAVQSGMANVAVDGVELAVVGTPAVAPGVLTKSIGPLHPRHFGIGARVGVVVVDDTIVDGDSTDVPILGLHSSGSRTVIRAIEGLAADPTVRAIVVRVDSPGGAVLASDQIWRAIRRARKRKPVVASMGRVAASGGYYVASAADEIWADPSTLTGSIGIFYGKVDVSELAEQLGVGVEVLRRGKRAGADSMYRPFTPDERAARADEIRRHYRLFLARVAEGRGMEPAAVHALGEGRVFTGDAAVANGLIDKLGGFASALTRARQLARLDHDSDVVILPERPAGLVDWALSGAGASTSVRWPPIVRGALQTASVWAGLTEGQTLAILPFSADF